MFNKLKTILIIVVTIIIASSISVYATYNYLASDIKYTKDDGTKTSVEEALNYLYDNEIDFSNMTLLWKPVSVTSGNNVSYSGTYKFTETYKYVVVVLYTNIWDSTVYSTTNMGLYKSFDIGGWNEGCRVCVYKNVNTSASIYFKITNLNRAGIGVWGIN